MPDRLNEPIAHKLGNRLDQKHDQERERDNRPDVVNPGRKEMIQIDGFVGDGQGEERKRRIDGSGIQDAIDDRHNQKYDGALRQRHYGKKYHARDHPEKVRANIT